MGSRTGNLRGCSPGESNGRVERKPNGEPNEAVLQLEVELGGCTQRRTWESNGIEGRANEESSGVRSGSRMWESNGCPNAGWSNAESNCVSDNRIGQGRRPGSGAGESNGSAYDWSNWESTVVSEASRTRCRGGSRKGDRKWSRKEGRTRGRMECLLGSGRESPTSSPTGSRTAVPNVVSDKDSHRAIGLGDERICQTGAPNGEPNRGVKRG